MTRPDSIRAVAFDCFGTPLTIRAPRNPWKRLVEEAGLKGVRPTPDPRREPIPTIEAFAAACGIDFRPEWRRDLDLEIASITLAPGAYDVLRHLRAAGFRLALASNLAPPYVPCVRRLLGDLVDVTCFSCAEDVMAVKPESVFFAALRKKLAVSAEDILMVGDSLSSDIVGARGAGMAALHLDPSVLDPEPGQIRNLYECLMALGLTDHATLSSPPAMSSSDDNRAWTLARALASIDLVSEQEAGRQLHLAPENLSGELGRRETRRELIRLQRGGDPFYPRFQFHTVNARTFPVVQQINEMKPAHMSTLRLCHWLTRKHADFGCAPAALFGRDDAAVLLAFAREIEPIRHG